MSIEIIEAYIEANGIWMLALLVALEYLGLPGYPGGIMLPAIGVMGHFGFIELPMGILVALVAGSVTMVAVYLVGLKFGSWSSRRFSKNEKFSRSYAYVQKLTEKYGSPAIFVVRLLPVVRTFGSVVAGMLGMNWRSYCIYSFAGNLVYTLCAVGLGYFATGFFV